MKGYKGFNKGLICREKQYAENTVFEEPEANICENGMHFCENPFDVLDYYGFVGRNGELNEFAEVESLDEVKTDDHRKYCTKKLRVGAKLSLTEFIQVCSNFVVGKPPVTQAISDVVSTVFNSKIASTGDFSTIVATGNCSKAASTGHNSKIASAGDKSNVATTGNNSKIASTGDNSNVASMGNWSSIASTGIGSTVVSKGDRSTVVSTGYDSKVISTGNNSKIASTGSDSDIVSTGSFSKVISTGEFCFVFCTGVCSWAKAKRGSWITLAEWK